MRILLILTTVLVCHPYFSTAQSFEGKLEYVSYFLNKETLQPMFDGVPETVTIKGAKCRVDVQNAQQGQLEWQIDNYLTGTTWYRKSYRNANYPITDKAPELKDGKLVFSKPDTPLVAPILRTKPCMKTNSPAPRLQTLDTTISINGYDCSVIIEYVDSIKTGEYYCYKGYNIDPAQYNCSRKDGLEHVYRYTKGQLIVQRVAFSDLYTLIYQLQKVNKVGVDEQVFNIPKGIPVKDETE